MNWLKTYVKKGIFLGYLFTLPASLLAQPQGSSGLGDAAASLLGDYSSDSLMDELLNSPFLSEEDRKQLEQMSPEEQEKLFDDVLGIFNDPEFQAILNDPEFAKQMEEMSQMFEGDDFDWDSLSDMEDFEEDAAPMKPPVIPTAPEEKSKTPQKPTEEACKTTGDVLQKIINHLTSLEQKSPYYESIEQYIDVFKTKIDEFKFYLEVLQKPENLLHLVSEDFASLNRSLCKIKDTLATFEPEILLEEKPSDESLYDPYSILGVHRGASEKDITARYEKIYQERSPEHVKERLMVKDLDKMKFQKKLKEAEITFQIIQKAYDDLMDEEYRQEIDRILVAERHREQGLEQLAQQAIWEIIRVLDEVFFSPGTVLKETKELLEKYDAQALEKLKIREAEEEKAAKKIEEYAKKQPRLMPVPPPAPERFDFPHGPAQRDRYPMPGRYDGYKPGVRPTGPSGLGGPGDSAKSGSKQPDKKDEKKDDKKKDGKKKDEKKDDKKKPQDKKEEVQDPVIKSINELDAMLNDIEGGKKGKIEDEKRQEFVSQLKGTREELKSMIANDLDAKLEKLNESLRLETAKNAIKKVVSSINESEEQMDRRGIPAANRKTVREPRKKAFDALVKEHKDVIEELGALGSLAAGDLEDEDKRKRYFGSIFEDPDKGPQTLAPESFELLLLQKNIGKFTKAFNGLKELVHPELKKQQQKK